ncbi:hypothetical protein AXF42_Ash015024 [Apostasia shenzhenica]|uniref:Uncharacterized protein n=1 Tax=Apostasia shenzhenica TaxID=1088818 RepID=A0A2I0B2X0_9ASPA|nr:hypothetical protein AXF42_Ash015024 [Apostasia shenzhenica]
MPTSCMEEVLAGFSTAELGGRIPRPPPRSRQLAGVLFCSSRMKGVAEVSVPNVLHVALRERHINGTPAVTAEFRFQNSMSMVTSGGRNRSRLD